MHACAFAAPYHSGLGLDDFLESACVEMEDAVSVAARPKPQPKTKAKAQSNKKAGGGGGTLNALEDRPA